MNVAHPGPEELLRLIDGEVTENRAGALRAHVAGCPACAAEVEAQRRLLARMAEPVAGAGAAFDEAAAVDRILARLGEAEPASPAVLRPRRGGLRWSLTVGLIASAAAAALLLPRWRATPEEAFVARGGAAAWSQKVGVTLHALEPARVLDPGAAVSPATAYVGAWRNTGASTAYLLAFAVDARGAVHWLYPAWLAEGTDPASTPLPPTSAEIEALLPDAVVLDGPAEGRLRCVLVVTRAPLTVSAIERLPPAERDPRALRQRWPDAAISTLDLVVAAPARRP